MPLPAIAAAGIPLVTSVLGSIFGNKAAKKTNKLTAEQLALDRRLADNQINISNYIQQLSKDLMARGTTQVDPYGGSTGYDEATGTYRTNLGAIPAGLQGASDQEELARYVIDQEIRRKGLGDFERLRGDAAGEADTARTDLADFRRGIGAVDPAALGARIRQDRTGAINAGFDDAARAAQTLQTRTGSSAVGDALTALARNRVRAQAEIGSPEVEALGIADQLNRGRLSDIASRYTSMADRGQQFYDASFTPAPYAGIADAKLADAIKLDLSKYEVGTGGAATAAAGIGSAAAGLRQAFALAEQNRVKNPTGDLITGIGRAIGSFANSKAF